MRREELLAILAGTVMGVLVGGAMVATRYVIAQSDPASLALLRYSLGTLGLIPPFLMIRRIRLEGRDLIPIALLGETITPLFLVGLAAVLAGFVVAHSTN